MNERAGPGRVEEYRRRMRLAEYYEQVRAVILSRQHPITGLLPASTAITTHGNYTDAWVRDNVYSILAIWGLAIAYRRQEREPDRAYELEQSVVKLMRGLLTSMMKQAPKVEAFKHSLNPLNALHAKYDTVTGDTVVGDLEWGHLQLDATSLFLLMLAQMTASGLRIVFTREEVDFVQNLVHYISRTYLTPDFGLWERGAKSNLGDTEINASSVGMAKAAMEALRGFDLFGGDGGGNSVIHVIEDDIANSRDTLEALLPRESNSKEVDAALLSVIGFPAFAVERSRLIDDTRHEVLSKLQGRYGCKRFLRDGHQTAVEDHDRLHYEAGELKQFEHIESEWPLFFTYLLLDALMRGDQEQADHYRNALEPLFVERDGQRLLPELYYVPKKRIAAEKARPHSQKRVANDNVPLVWAQSLFVLGALLMEHYIYPSDIDPLDRRWASRSRRETKVQLVLLAEGPDVEALLDDHGIQVQTPEQIAPVHVAAPKDLGEAYCAVGRNEKLALTGRPPRRLDTLVTSQAFTLRGKTFVFLPSFLDTRHSYFYLDNALLVEQIKAELLYVSNNWRQPGRPLMTLMINRSMLEAEGNELLVALLKEAQAGSCNGVDVRVARVAEHLPGAARASIDHLHDFHPPVAGITPDRSDHCQLKDDPAAYQRISAQAAAAWRSEEDTDKLLAQLGQENNLYGQIELLGNLWERLDPGAPTALGASLRELAEQLYCRAAPRRIWSVMRRAAALLGWYDERLEAEVAKILVRGMRVAVGRSFASEAVIEKPLSNVETMARINAYGGDDPRIRVLIQEIVMLLGMLVKIDPEAFKDTFTLQCWHLLLLLNGELAWERRITQDEAFEELLELNPYSIMERLRKLLTSAGTSVGRLASIESLHLNETSSGFVSIDFTPDYDPPLEDSEAGWVGWRKLKGAVTRLPGDFCEALWEDLGQCPGIVIGDRLDSHNRLDSQLVRADMTPGEKNFVRLLEDKINHIQAPEYRQLVIEALRAVSRLFRANPALSLDSYVIMDVLIGHSVRLHWESQPDTNERAYQDHSSEAWARFYAAPPHQVANAVVAAFEYLLQEVEQSAIEAGPPGESAGEAEAGTATPAASKE